MDGPPADSRQTPANELRLYKSQVTEKQKAVAPCALDTSANECESAWRAIREKLIKVPVTNTPLLSPSSAVCGRRCACARVGSATVTESAVRKGVIVHLLRVHLSRCFANTVKVDDNR